MVRQRKPTQKDVNHDHSNLHRENYQKHFKNHFNGADYGNETRHVEWFKKPFYLIPFLIVIGTVAYFLFLGFKETRINTPLNTAKVIVDSGLDVPELYWGTYRPGVYFGTRTRHPRSLVTGLMWYVPGHIQNNILAVRHWCSQDDDMKQYGWVKHDGKNFGSQEIKDKFIDIKTDFIKQPGGEHGGEWSARISVTSKSQSHSPEASLIYYIALDPDDKEGHVTPIADSSHSFASVVGHSESTGKFQLHVYPIGDKVVDQHYLNTIHDGLDNLRETVLQGIRTYKRKNNERYYGLGGDIFKNHLDNQKSNFVAFQISGKVPFEIEVVYKSSSFDNKRTATISGDTFSALLHKYSDSFDKTFESKFKLKKNGFDDEAIQFAQAALSNMVGGIGYFYGASRVLGELNQEPIPYWRAPLFSAVPSRSFFPRGFLWDEGFHNLLISKWDDKLSIDILGHWFDLMNWDGWIPREQILGVEARARVPKEFIVQKSKNANPPTLLLTLHSMLLSHQHDSSAMDLDYLTRLWPRLKTWYNWFNTTQLGEIPGSYRWRGRDPNAIQELNPKTLTSGLDDYPRASHPTLDERHLDLRCWMCLASSVMAEISTLIGKDPTKYKDTYNFLSDNQNLDALHWSYTANGYMDYGLHTDAVHLGFTNHPERKSIRIVDQPPQLQYVNSFGYISFFPLFLQIIDPESPKLGRVLEDLRKPSLLWTKYGLRSLAKNSPIYRKHNTEHDPPYWRGAIWINMNYLAVRSLNYYSNTPGPHQNLAKEIYTELRNNIIVNILKEYKRTGYLWEQYDDQNGKGKGCRPFTGWTALVVLMMSENY